MRKCFISILEGGQIYKMYEYEIRRYRNLGQTGTKWLMNETWLIKMHDGSSRLFFTACLNWLAKVNNMIFSTSVTLQSIPMSCSVCLSWQLSFSLVAEHSLCNDNKHEKGDLYTFSGCQLFHGALELFSSLFEYINFKPRPSWVLIQVYACYLGSAPPKSIFNAPGFTTDDL